MSKTSRLIVGAVVCLFPASVLVACGDQSPRAQLARDAREIVSWSAAVRLIVDRWQNGAAPTAYTLDALRDAREDIEQQIDSIDGLKGIGNGERLQARETARQIAALCQRLHELVRQSNGADAERVRRRLAAIEASLRQMAREEAPRQ